MRRESEPFTDRSPITVAGSASVRHYPPMSYQGRDRRWCRWVLRRQNGWLPEKDSPNPTLPCRPRGGKSRSEREPAHEVSGPSRGTDGSNPVPSSEESAANPESLDQAVLISGGPQVKRHRVPVPGPDRPHIIASDDRAAAPKSKQSKLRVQPGRRPGRPTPTMASR
jgi:hypothetical protein